MRIAFFAAYGSVALAALGATASCASEREREPLADVTDADAAADGGERTPSLPPREDASTSDADAAADSGPADAGAVDAATFDGGPLPITCASRWCARSLVTTRGSDNYDSSEGFCARLDDGAVACWGAGSVGQLGRGTWTHSATPARVTGLANVTQLDHTCALDSAGSIWCWGMGAFLRNDAGSVSAEPVPFKVPLPPATRVALGVDAACAVVNGNVVCWGANVTRVVSSAPTSPLANHEVVLPTGAPVRDLRVGAAAFALRTDGETVSWGAKALVGRVTSLSNDPEPFPLQHRDVSSLDVTDDNACATAAGTGYCWGLAMTSNGYPPTHFYRALPHPVVAPEPLVQIATSRSISPTWDVIQPQRWCAVSATGEVYCWGYNRQGQVGDGTTDHAYDATRVTGLPAPAVEVRTHANSTCALLTTGDVFCWGSNDYGQLGSGTLGTPSLTPQRVELP